MKKRNYSILILPISILVHIIFLNVLFFGWKFHFTENPFFPFFLNLSWLVIAYFSKIYSFNRNIKITRVVTQLLVQFATFTLVVLSYFTVAEHWVHVPTLLKLLALFYFMVTVFRALYFSALRKYRVEGGNYKRVILIGSEGLKPLTNFMMNYSSFGYKILGFFSDDENPELTYDITNKALKNNGDGVVPHLGKISESKQYALDHHIDEIYCSLSEFSHETLQDFLDFGDQHFIVVKLVPDVRGVLGRNMYQEYYGAVPVLSLRKLPFDKPLVKYGKRLFDIAFSLFIIVFVLSWLTPILYILIKKESKGPLFFKQVRDGLRGDTFMCYKFRSMRINDRSEKDQTVKGDPRVTRIGQFIRKTSIDELPQFINVLKGDMSVVGPRPHMLSQSDRFKKIVSNYMVRHYVKPGITGLAQVKGYRGEIETDEDIINRVRYDIFYIENWSFILDLNIIIRTVLNVFKGEEKAY